MAAIVLVVLLAGLTFLFQMRPRSLLNDYKSRLSKKSKLVAPHKENEANVVSKESDFPTDWWAGSDLFELERRAIFSKRWLCLSHRSRFSRAGDYHSYEVAGIPIFLILGKDGVVRAFHNVCRHRAYTVTRKESGSSLVLGCRYHGWSFNTYGQLVKAPHFDQVPGFDRSQNGLFAIHTATTSFDFILVNLEASATVAPLEASPFDFLASRHGLGGQSTWVGGQTMEGQFNWKICLRLKRFIDDETWVQDLPRQAYTLLLWRLSSNLRKHSDDIRVSPFTTIHTVKNTVYWYSLSFIPISERRTSIRFDLYCSKDSGNLDSFTIPKRLIDLLTKRTLALEVEYKSFTDDSGFAAITIPTLDPNTEVAQKEILDLLKSHTKLERQQGTEVFPATRKPRKNARFEQAEQLCKELDCQDTLNRKSLAW
ncbi:iron-sulfur cluster-binding protein [Aspergillus ellipticus CBS 707.79]|uniref:Iron-sulfur cluster-binding protein n=1 Tax=Aspergillus ellipticus CBS 707.79 TaxID=1448320 RepID=A0A319DA19_9EURO|nr:iron-sulfur cluster-binding protein [Aspergillus ellipticus CBS 707.79]